MSRNDWLISLGFGFLFCVFMSQNFWLPGPHYDEVFAAAPAVNFYENRYETIPMQIDPSTVTLMGREMPLMLLTYLGSLKSMIYVPVFILFGDSLPVIRGLPIALGFLVIVVSYFFFRDAFNRPTAIVTTVLLISDPGFVFFVGRDFGPPALALLLKMAGLLFFLKWWRAGKQPLLILGSFLWGLALFHKADFLWVLTAVGVAALLFYGKNIRARMTMKMALASLAVFFLGAAPFLLLNILTGGATFSRLFEQSSVGNQDPLLLSSLWLRCTQFVSILNGTETFKLFLGTTPELNYLQRVMLPGLVIFSFFLLPVLCMFNKIEFSRRRALFFFTVTAIVFVQTAKTAHGSFGGWHLLGIYPFAQASAAVALVSVIQKFKPRSARVAKGFLAGFLIAAFLAGGLTMQQTQAAIERTGGSGYWSDAIYELDTFLESQQKPIVAVDWGFTNSLIVLSKGKLKITRLYKEFYTNPVNEATVEPFIDPSNLYLCYSIEFECFRGTNQAFIQAAMNKGFKAYIQKTFIQRDGREVYRLYALLPIK